MVVANSRAMRLAGLAPADDGDDPWSSAQTVQPADLVKELAAPPHPDEPAVVCVGFRPLYLGAHLPHAVFPGPASTDAGLAELKSWGQKIPKESKVGLDCVCCPVV